MEKEYGYFISYVYIKENFSLDFFASNQTNVVGNAFVSYDKKLEDFLLEDYNKIKNVIAEKLCEQLNAQNKEFHDKYNKEKEYKYNDNIVKGTHIMILNIIPKKYEVFDDGENN